MRVAARRQLDHNPNSHLTNTMDVTKDRVRLRTGRALLDHFHRGSRRKSGLDEVWPFKVFKMAAGRHLRFEPTGNGAVRSAVHENPTLEPNMKGIG